MQTILVPVDFSPASNNALLYAANLAKVMEAKLFLLHAYMLPTPVSEVPFVMTSAESLQHENEDLLKKSAEEITAQFQVEANWEVRIGIASDEIKSLTHEQTIDLVIMGMKGAGSIEKIIGSTTTNVIRKIKVPVLIVPHDAGYAPVSNIVYASDFTYKKSFHLFDPLLNIAKKFKSVINILHIQLIHTAESAAILMGKKELEDLFAGYNHRFVTIEEKSVTAGINSYLQKNAANLLVMVAHKHDFFERIFSRNHTKEMAYETHTPMLVLQDKE
jgi:nucleotide-binding universal stress UspA family protein